MSLPETLVDWDTVNWDTVDLVKAEFFYGESQTVLRELIDSHNVMNSKAFHLLALVGSIVVAIVSVALSRWEAATIDVRVASAVFVLGCLIAMTRLGKAIWPRDVPFSAGEPEAYFSTSLYAQGMLDILHSSIMTNSRQINSSHQAMLARKKALRSGLLWILASIASGITAFLYSRFFL